MWTFVLTKLDGTPIAEVKDGYERKFTANLSKPATASFNVRKDNALMPYLFEDESKLLQVYNDKTIHMWGPVISTQLQAQEGQPASVAVQAADVGWRLSRRLAGKSEKGTTYTAKDKSIAAGEIVTAVDADSPIGIEAVSVVCGSTGTYTAGPYKEALACINDLAHGVDGFDWIIMPSSSPLIYPGRIGTFYSQAVIGKEKPNQVFEFGTGRRNMRSISFLRDISTEVNQAYHVSDGGVEVTPENATPVVTAKDAASITARGLFEEVVELSGVLNTTMRTKWVEENVSVRKDPRRVLAMTSDIDDGTGRVPTFATSEPVSGNVNAYELGDIVPVRAVVEDTVLFNGNARIYSVQVELNDAGTAKITPILVEET